LEKKKGGKHVKGMRKGKEAQEKKILFANKRKIRSAFGICGSSPGGNSGNETSTQ